MNDDKIPAARPYDKDGKPVGGMLISDAIAAHLFREPRGAPEGELAKRFGDAHSAPNARAFEKKELVLPHIYINGIVDAAVLCTIDSTMTIRTAQQTLAHFAGKKLVARVDLPGVPVKVYRLTPEGARWVNENAPSAYTSLVRPWVSDSLIPQKEAEHKLLIQLTTHHVRHQVLPKVLGDSYSPGLVQVKPERIIRARNEKLTIAHKFPDSMVTHEYSRVTKEGTDNTPIRIAIETQETSEPAETTERIITMYLYELRQGSIDYVIWASTKPRVAAQYDPLRLETYRNDFFYNADQVKWHRRTGFDEYSRRIRIKYDFCDVIDRILPPIDLSHFRGRYYRR